MSARDEQLTQELLSVLGPDGFLALVERYGGTRLFVPRLRGALARVVGRTGAQALARHYAGSYIRVPLARAWRAARYRGLGHSNAEIARRLGMTETGVDKIFSRMAGAKPARGAQLDLFRDGPRKAG